MGLCMSMTELPELSAFLEANPDPQIIMDDAYRILGANAAYIAEFSAGEPVVGRHCYEVSHHIDVPCDQLGESCPLRQSAASGMPQRVLHLHHTARGEEHVDVEIRPIRGMNGPPRYFVETMRCIRQASSQAAAQGMVGRSPAFVAMLEKVMRVAGTEASVLLLGETGTGKELVARAVHESSKRARKAFVAVDCAGLTETLFESELFGYERGAFTGANQRKLGLVEAAAGGTLFIDEIGELPLAVQAKLLRVLETGTFRRVGGLEWIPVDFRLVAATHRDLRKMVLEERFRRDLFYRLNVFPIHVPSLRERQADIPLLAKSLLERVDPRSGRRFSERVLDALSRKAYEGNIRELRNIVERAALLSDQEVIDLDAFLDLDDASPIQVGASSFSLDEPLSLPDLERRYIAWLAARCAGDLMQVANVLGVSLRTVYRKVAE